jgi:ethanolamine utilization protein EutA (predicted chaperonin)
MHDDIFEHTHISDLDRQIMVLNIRRQDTVEMKTVGIDIGSSTSHLLFANIILQRQAQALSSRFVMVGRKVLWRSPIMLTPFLPDGTIDAAQLGRFIRAGYRAAGFTRSDIDSGAVILTGEAVKRKNAQAIDELFAEDAGKFVCATAGHRLESMLAAHGSGAVRLSKERRECLLHIDVGGGTTKLALIDGGEIVGVNAFAVGGRLIATDSFGVWTRVDDSAHLVAADLGLATDPTSLASVPVRRRIARRLASIAVDCILGAPLDRLGSSLQLTNPLPRTAVPTILSFSGGVSEYLFGREHNDYGDIAGLLAGELRAELAARVKLPVIDPGQGIRATVIGASQFTVQVSGKTIYVPDRATLPVRNVPVVQLKIDPSHPNDAPALRGALEQAITRLDLAPEACMAIAFAWKGDPEHSRMSVAGKEIMRAVASPTRHREQPLLLMIDGDVGSSLGHLLRNELGFSGPLVSIDGVQLKDLDYVDVGQLIEPAGVVPVVIKSLLFS